MPKEKRFNDTIYISLTKKGDMAFIFSSKDKKSMYISRLKLDSSFYDKFQYHGDFFITQNQDGSYKDIDINSLRQEDTHRKELLYVVEAEVRNHFDKFTTNPFTDIVEGLESGQFVSKVDRFIINIPIEDYTFWMDLLWLRVYRMTKSLHINHVSSGYTKYGWIDPDKVAV